MKAFSNARHHPRSLVLGLGGYRTYAVGNDIKCQHGKYEMIWTLILRDYYRWDITSNIPGGVLMVDSDLAKMHRFGEMREFAISGHLQVKVSWKAKERVNSGADIEILSHSRTGQFSGACGNFCSAP